MADCVCIWQCQIYVLLNFNFGVTWTEVVLDGNLSISIETDIMSADSEAVEISFALIGSTEQLSKMAPSNCPHLVLQAMAGPLAAATASTVTNPMDVVRARVQVISVKQSKIRQPICIAGMSVLTCTTKHRWLSKSGLCKIRLTCKPATQQNWFDVYV